MFQSSTEENLLNEITNDKHKNLIERLNMLKTKNIIYLNMGNQMIFI